MCCHWLLEMWNCVHDNFLGSLGRIASRLQRASNLRSPFQVPSCREVEGQTLSFPKVHFWQSLLWEEKRENGEEEGRFFNCHQLEPMSSKFISL